MAAVERMGAASNLPLRSIGAIAEFPESVCPCGFFRLRSPCGGALPHLRL